MKAIVGMDITAQSRRDIVKDQDGTSIGQNEATVPEQTPKAKRPLDLHLLKRTAFDISLSKSNRFKRLYASREIDQFLLCSIEYFKKFLTVEQAKRKHDTEKQNLIFRFNPWASKNKEEEKSLGKQLEENKAAAFKELGYKYAHLLTKERVVMDSNEERNLFKSLQDLTYSVCKLAFVNKRDWPIIDGELSRLLCTESQRYGSSQSKDKTKRSSSNPIIMARSPLIANIYPTEKDKAKQFKYMTLQNGTFPIKSVSTRKEPQTDVEDKSEWVEIDYEDIKVNVTYKKKNEKFKRLASNVKGTVGLTMLFSKTDSNGQRSPLRRETGDWLNTIGKN